MNVSLVALWPGVFPFFFFFFPFFFFDRQFGLVMLR